MPARIQDYKPSVDVLSAILWQYDSAPNLISLVTQKQQWYEENHVAFWNDWVRDVFDIRTANDFGLSVWSIILDLPLYTDTPTSTDVGWGFGEFRRNFNNGNFLPPQNSIVSLTTETKRTLLRIRYFQLVGDGNVISINRFFSKLLGYRTIYAVDNFDMTMDYHFDHYQTTSELRYAVQLINILPSPTGVGINLILDVPGVDVETESLSGAGGFIINETLEY